jgi:hypothetical protein
MKSYALRLTMLFCAYAIAFNALLVGGAPARAEESPARGPQTLIWQLNNLAVVGGVPTELVGAPQLQKDENRSVACFDGVDDGVFVPVNPIEGWAQFTIEICFKPDGSGPPAQRFLHIQDMKERRALIETRLMPGKQWALDTFLFESNERRLTLIDRSRLHPTDRWYWAALVYDGKMMAHYVDGVREIQGAVQIAPMDAGRISLGVRQNKIYWFKGLIAEVRFTPAALTAERLQRCVDGQLPLSGD